MAVLVNFKICDNAKECGGVAVCPTGAFSYDDEKDTIVIDNDKCIPCGLCEKECPIGAIIVTKTEEEYQKAKKEIEEDPRTIKDLFVDRYGASPLSEFFMIRMEQLEEKVNRNSFTLIECYQEDSIECLIKSIPIKKLTEELPKDTLFYKMEVDDSFIKKYQIKEVPSLLVFRKGILEGKIEGYYTEEKKDEFIEKLHKIVK